MAAKYVGLEEGFRRTASTVEVDSAHDGTDKVCAGAFEGRAASRSKFGTFRAIAFRQSRRRFLAKVVVVDAFAAEASFPILFHVQLLEIFGKHAGRADTYSIGNSRVFIKLSNSLNVCVPGRYSFCL